MTKSSGSENAKGNGAAKDDIPEKKGNGAARKSKVADMKQDPDAIRLAFETGQYPYKQKMRRNDYEKQKKALQVELLKAHGWAKITGRRL